MPPLESPEHSLFHTLKPVSRALDNRSFVNPGMVCILLERIIQMIAKALSLLSADQQDELISPGVTVIALFPALFSGRDEAHKVEKINKASNLSGRVIPDRFYFLCTPAHMVLAEITDE
jgi:hypothetical protein